MKKIFKKLGFAALFAASIFAFSCKNAADDDDDVPATSAGTVKIADIGTNPTPISVKDGAVSVKKDASGDLVFTVEADGKHGLPAQIEVNGKKYDIDQATGEAKVPASAVEGKTQIEVKVDFPEKSGDDMGGDTPDNPPSPAATFTVTFKAGDGSGEDYTQTFTEGVSQALSDCKFAAPTPEGHFFFDCWKDQDGTEYNDAESITPTKDLTLTANYYLEITQGTESRINDDLKAKPNGTYKVKAKGSFGEAIAGSYDESKFNDFQKALSSLYSSNSSIKVKLDLSEVEGLTSIGNYYAFYDCTSLSSIDIPDSVTSIGNYAFYDCTSLSSIDIPDSVTSIGWGAFDGCKSLSSIEIPAGVTRVHAFHGCTSLSGIDVANGNENYCSQDGVLFNKDKTTLIAYPASKAGTSYEIPASVTFIDDYAFDGCTSLSSIDIPDGVTSIGLGAFDGCTSLSSIEIPDSVAGIGNYAFRNCTSLSDIEFKGTKPPFYSSLSVFYNIAADAKIWVPDSAVYAYKTAMGWSYTSNVHAVSERE